MASSDRGCFLAQDDKHLAISYLTIKWALGNEVNHQIKLFR